MSSFKRTGAYLNLDWAKKMAPRYREYIAYYEEKDQKTNHDFKTIEVIKAMLVLAEGLIVEAEAKNAPLFAKVRTKAPTQEKINAAFGVSMDPNEGEPIKLPLGGGTPDSCTRA